LAGKVAIVTGGAGGCGEEYGRGLTAAGAAVVLADLDGDRAEVHASELRAQGHRAVGVHVDITDPEAAEAMVQRARDDFGGVDILINNAALMKEIPMASLLTLDLKWWDRVMAVNVKGALVCSRAAVPTMLERGGGRIINQVSGGAFIPGGLYSISKLALVSLTASLATELGPQGINVNAWPTRPATSRWRRTARCAPASWPRCRGRRKVRPTTSWARSCCWPPAPATGSMARRSASTAAGS
jgi:NAD(P)-dependent dehydrogenase (short-subunit alcohol dehydrogenase family)